MIFKGLLGGLFGSGDSTKRASAPADPTEYKGYRILPEPYAAKGQFQTAGRIVKDFGDDTKEHAFVRAETHASRDDAVTFSVSKAKQIIDEQGDRIFS